jgi:hypothetical protein
LLATLEQPAASRTDPETPAEKSVDEELDALLKSLN